MYYKVVVLSIFRDIEREYNNLTKEDAIRVARREGEKNKDSLNRVMVEIRTEAGYLTGFLNPPGIEDVIMKPW